MDAVGIAFWSSVSFVLVAVGVWVIADVMSRRQ